MNPKLAPHIELLRAGPDSYIAMDRASDRRSHLNSQTYFLLRFMDGTRSQDDILAAYSKRFGSEMPRRTLKEFLTQIDRLAMLDGPASQHPAGTNASAPEATDMPAGGSVFLNRVFDVLAAALSWLVHPASKFATCALAVVAATGVIREWPQLMDGFYYYWQSPPVLPLALAPYMAAWLFSLSAGAVMTGVVCRHHKGWVNGLRLRFFRGVIPLIYCDTGDSYIRMDRRGKWSLLTVRMWTYLGIATIAALVWKALPVGSPLALYASVFLVVNALSLLTSVIVFLPRDGSRIVGYLNHDPNFRQRALTETGAWLGMYGSREALGSVERWRLRWFGLGIVFTYVVLALLAIAFPARWLTEAYGARGALVILVLFVWALYGPVRMLFERMMRRTPPNYQRGSVHIRWAVRMGVLAVLVVLALMPYGYDVSGEARLITGAEFGARAQVSGQLAKVYVREGEWVEPGTVLARIDNPTIANSPQIIVARLERVRAESDLVVAGSRGEEIAIARSELARARAELKVSEVEFTRLESIVKKDAVAAAQLDREKYQVEAAQHRVTVGVQQLALAESGRRTEEIARAAAQVQEIEAMLVEAQQLAAFLEIRSSIAGYVVTPDLAAQERQYVNPGDLVLTVSNDDNLRVEIAAEEPAGVLIQPGAAVDIRLAALDGRLLTGKVISVSRVAETWRPTEAVRTDQEQYLDGRLAGRDEGHHFRIIAELEPTDLTLRPGMRGYGRVFVREEMFWQALVRPVLRFFRTEVWSWLP